MSIGKFFKRTAYIEAFLLFSLIPAYYVWGSIVRTLCSFILAAFLLKDIFFYGSSKKNGISIIFTLLYIYLAYVSNKNILGIIFSLTIPIILFVRSAYLKRILNSFRDIYAIITCISLLVYFCVLYLGIDLPSRTIAPLNKLKSGYYVLYPFFVYYQNVAINFRFSCLFDEPGVVGTISALLLLLDNFNLKKWQNIIILISGIFSFSFFFYILCALYLLLTPPYKYKFLYIPIIIIILYLFRDNEVVNTLVFSRFEITDGQIAGDNRVGLGFDSFYNSFKQSNRYWLGLGPGTASLIDPEGSSYKHVIVDYGVLFFAIYILTFLGYAIKLIKRYKSFFIYTICVLGTMYQRPLINQITLVFILISSVYILKDSEIIEYNDK